MLIRLQTAVEPFIGVPLVDTTNPFIARNVPSDDETFVIIRFDDPKALSINFPQLLTQIQGSFLMLCAQQHACHLQNIHVFQLVEW